MSVVFKRMASPENQESVVSDGATAGNLVASQANSLKSLSTEQSSMSMEITTVTVAPMENKTPGQVENQPLQVSASQSKPQSVGQAPVIQVSAQIQETSSQKPQLDNLQTPVLQARNQQQQIVSSRPVFSIVSQAQGQPQVTNVVTPQVVSQPQFYQVGSQIPQQVFSPRHLQTVSKISLTRIVSPVQQNVGKGQQTVGTQGALSQTGGQTQGDRQGLAPAAVQDKAPRMTFQHILPTIAPKQTSQMPVIRKVPIPRQGVGNVNQVPLQSPIQVPVLQQAGAVPGLFAGTPANKAVSIVPSQQLQFQNQIQTQTQPEILSPVFNPSLPCFVAVSNPSQQTGVDVLTATAGPGSVYCIINKGTASSGGTILPQSRRQSSHHLTSSERSQNTHCSSDSAACKVQNVNQKSKKPESTEMDTHQFRIVEDDPSEILKFQDVTCTDVSVENYSQSHQVERNIEDALIDNSTAVAMEVDTLSDNKLKKDLDRQSVTEFKILKVSAVAVESLDFGLSEDYTNFHESVLNLMSNKCSVTNTVDDIEKDKTSSLPENETAPSSDEMAAMDVSYGDLKEHGEVNTDAMENSCKECEDEGEEETFIWEEFLMQTGTAAVPHTAFKHVEYSLQSGFVKGMKLEVPNASDLSTFWVATVLTTCGPLLRLKYDGYKEDDTAGEFWCDRATMDVHEIGWCAQNGKNLQPPEEIRETVTDWHQYMTNVLTGARTAPAYLLEKGVGSSPVDQLKCSMRLEIQDALEPTEVWLVQILENVGGRLYLRLEGTESASKHFWMFYLDPCLHYIGWASEQEYSYRPPLDIRSEHTQEQWEEILNNALKDSETDTIPDGIFKDQVELKPHSFQVGMKLEALIPDANVIGPATVTRVVNDKYFIIEIDDVRGPDQRESIQLCCHSEYLGIFPVSWCLCKGIRLIPPPGWKNTEFVWGEYLSHCGAKAAPEKLFNSGTDEHEFERGMKLEAVNPKNPNQICAATITKIVGPLLWIHLDHMRDIPSHIEDIDSHNLFPVGWCESNNFQLKPPSKARRAQRRLSDVKTEELYHSLAPSDEETEKESWSPKIYFNHRCFSGPYLSKGRIADLPKSVGPGPMHLVLKEVLGLLINVAYKSCRALKEIQLDGPHNPHMKQCVLKAKYKGKTYKGVVEVCKYEDLLEEFCRNVCIKLECCPYIFSPLHVLDYCPENCQQMTKTKYNYNYGSKKKKPAHLQACSRPILKSGTLKGGLKRGRKKKSFLLTHKKGKQRHVNTRPYIPVGERENYGDFQDDEGFIDGDDDYDQVRNKRKHSYQQYEIQTRGAKLPKYSFERRTHKKIYKDSSEHYSDSSKKQVYVSPGGMGTERVLQPREGSMKLKSNPLYWSVGEVVQYIKATDCSHLARIIKEEEVDGQAFLLLDLATLQEHLELKLGPAVKLCHQIERLKVAFFEQFA